MNEFFCDRYLLPCNWKLVVILYAVCLFGVCAGASAAEPPMNDKKDPSAKSEKTPAQGEPISGDESTPESIGLFDKMKAAGLPGYDAFNVMRFAQDERNVRNRRFVFEQTVIPEPQADGRLWIKVPIPFRLFLEGTSDDRSSKVAGSISGVSSWRANLRSACVLSDDDTLRPLPLGVRFSDVEKAGRHIYVGENFESILILRCEADAPIIKDVVENKRAYFAKVEVSGLRRIQMFDNGYYLLSELRAKDGDSDELVNWNSTGAFGIPKVPLYFRPEMAKPPFVVEATLSSVELIHRKSNNVVGEYRR